LSATNLSFVELGDDVRDVDKIVSEFKAVEHLPAGTAHHAIWLMRRHFFSAFPHSIFPLRPIALIAPSLKIGFAAFRQEHAPSGFEGGAGIMRFLTVTFVTVDFYSRSCGVIAISLMAWLA
jgi:hypothetical protein